MKKVKKRNEIGIAFIKCSFNNTIVTITDPYGNVVAWSSGGSCGFKNARKSTPFASKCASLIAAKQAGFDQVRVLISGPGPGRETAIRGLQQAGLHILLIRDRTSIPHNGCRPPKRRRV